MGKVAIIDADSMVYRAALSVERVRYMVESPDGGFLSIENAKEANELAEEVKGDVWVNRKLGKVEDATKKFDELMEKVDRYVVPNSRAVYLSGLLPGFRDSIASIRRYKGNRDGTARPAYFSHVRDWACSRWGATFEPNWEADDLVSIEARSVARAGSIPIVVGNDKDLDQIPCKHYNWQLDLFYDVNETEARAWMWMQVLMGDSTDNIVGCWRMGFQKAKNRISKWIEKENLPDWRIWDLVVEEFRESQKLDKCPYKGMTPQAVVEETVGLVRLRTTRDDVPWTRQTITSRSAVSNHGRDNQEPATSTCAGSAREAGKFCTTQPTSDRSLAQCATDSEKWKEAGTQV